MAFQIKRDNNSTTTKTYLLLMIQSAHPQTLPKHSCENIYCPGAGPVISQELLGRKETIVLNLPCDRAVYGLAFLDPRAVRNDDIRIFPG